jgi:hypothetical protein
VGEFSVGAGIEVQDIRLPFPVKLTNEYQVEKPNGSINHRHYH